MKRLHFGYRSCIDGIGFHQRGGLVLGVLWLSLLGPSAAPPALAAEDGPAVHLNAPIALESILPCAPNDPIRYFTLNRADDPDVEAVILCLDGKLHLYLPLAPQTPPPRPEEPAP